MGSLREINLLSISLRIILALIIGGLLGLERGRKNRPAGLRTYMLVCLGSALVMMTNQYVFQLFAVSDLVRMGAQVVSGIGFLGAGSIIITGKSQIKGITTAAGLWTAACSGLAIGAGFYEGALLGGIAVYFVMVYMQRLDNYIQSRSDTIVLYLEYEVGRVFRSFLEYARTHNFIVSDVQITKNQLDKNIVFDVVLTAKSTEKRTHAEMVEILSGAPGVLHLEEL